MTDTQLAANREALTDVLSRFIGQERHISRAVDAILSSGQVRDAGEVDMEAYNQGRAELQATIEALCEEWDSVPTAFADSVRTRLRALLADDGAALREVKAQAQREVIDRVQAIYDMQCPVRAEGDYVPGAVMAHAWWETVLGAELRRLRDTAGEAGDA